MPRAWLENKYQVLRYFFDSNTVRTHNVRINLIFQNERRTLYSFNHPALSHNLLDDVCVCVYISIQSTLKYIHATLVFTVVGRGYLVVGAWCFVWCSDDIAVKADSCGKPVRGSFTHKACSAPAKFSQEKGLGQEIK